MTNSFDDDFDKESDEENLDKIINDKKEENSNIDDKNKKETNFNYNFNYKRK